MSRSTDASAASTPQATFGVVGDAVAAVPSAWHLGLHVRARRLAVWWAATVALAVTAWPIDRWLAARGTVSDVWLGARPIADGDGDLVRLPLTVAAALAAALLASITMSGVDVELDRSVPRLSRRWRATHTAVIMLLPGALLAIATTPEAWGYGSAAVLRNTVGLLGMLLLAATVLPPSLAWSPALAYAAVTFLTVSRSAESGAEWWAWILEPGRSGPSWAIAVTLAVVGTAAYVLRGPARHDETG